MAAVQMACARVGLATGAGLATALRKKFPRWILIVICLALFFANSLNIGADLAAMADCAQMLTKIPSFIYVIFFGTGIAYATVMLPYSSLSNVLKWLALFLFAYIATAFIARPNWGQVLRDTVSPHWPKEKAEWSTLVALLGTTISPYL